MHFEHSSKRSCGGPAGCVQNIAVSRDAVAVSRHLASCKVTAHTSGCCQNMMQHLVLTAGVFTPLVHDLHIGLSAGEMGTASGRAPPGGTSGSGKPLPEGMGEPPGDECTHGGQPGRPAPPLHSLPHALAVQQVQILVLCDDVQRLLAAGGICQ